MLLKEVAIRIINLNNKFYKNAQLSIFYVLVTVTLNYQTIFYIKFHTGRSLG